MVRYLAAALLALIIVSCAPPKEEPRKDIYTQDFEASVAFLVLESNGKPQITASGFIADKEQGIFYTAKHFTDEFGSLGHEYCRVFFNGRVYKAILVKVPPTQDAGLIRLLPPFSPENLQEPMPIATVRPKVGDKIFAQGFHSHPFWLRMENEASGFPETVVPIFADYYKQIMRDLSREQEVVFHNLEGEAVEPRFNPVFPDSNVYENDGYIKVLFPRDHKFSFGGLSGGAARNDRGEVVGIMTAQDIYRFEYDENGLFFDPHSGQFWMEIKKQIYDTLYVTPIDTLQDLRNYVSTLN